MNVTTEKPQGRRRPARTPKGRQLDPQALADVAALLGDRPRRRDLLIEYLHLIQDKYGYISGAHLAALADEMKLAQAEVYEVATFYAHFDVVKEGETPPPPVTVRVCDSLSCAMEGAERLLRDLPAALGADVRVMRAPCMGACDRAPVCAVGHAQVFAATTDIVADAVKAAAHPHAYPTQNGFDAYRAGGGYRLLAECLDGKRTREDVIKAVSDAGLRGLGGAGFPTGRKWTLVRAEPAPRLMAVNGDEGEPGTFKDRYYLEQRSAPLHRGHADRRLGGRSARRLFLSARRVSRGAAPAGARARQGRSGGRWRGTPGSTCGAAPAPTSAAKSPR